jgi:hypothetical protein
MDYRSVLLNTLEPGDDEVIVQVSYDELQEMCDKPRKTCLKTRPGQNEMVDLPFEQQEHITHYFTGLKARLAEYGFADSMPLSRFLDIVHQNIIVPVETDEDGAIRGLDDATLEMMPHEEKNLYDR